ncbi:MAG: YIP1 family protein [Ignavibacterium sp.]
MENNETLNTEQTNQQEELSHSDKMIGVFTEPSNTFETIAKFPVRSIDWVLPVVIVFILIGLMRSLAMLNEEVALQTRQTQIEMFDKMVSEGKMTQEQADQAIEGIEKQMEFMRGPVGWIINVVSTLIFGFIFFFIIAGIYFLFIKFLFKGEGNYQHVLVASGLTSYITVIQVLIGGILTFLLGKIIMDTSVANFIELEKGSLVKFFVSKIDPISIWAYSVLAIGLAKLNRAQSSTPYFVLVFALWILGGLLFFILGKVFPFLGGFGG